MSSGRDRLVVGTSGRHVLVYDLRKLTSGQAGDSLEQQRESSLKYQTRSLAVYTDGRGYALGSVEGRVAMEFFDAEEAQVCLGVCLGAQGGLPTALQRACAEERALCKWPGGGGLLRDSLVPPQRLKYAFKCHRRNEGGKDTVFPVHCITFHPGERLSRRRVHTCI
jgi:cell cycle arrest protein BUB3